MFQENPKLVGSRMISCRPQAGNCPFDCNQCYYNRSSYVQQRHPNIPTVQESVGKLVRMNDEHDSNIERSLVIKTALLYADSFFNTSFQDVCFPRPVVLTVNPREEDDPIRWTRPRDVLCPSCFDRIMFVRFRVSVENVNKCFQAAEEWKAKKVPSVLTFMRYYDKAACPSLNAYEERVHLLHPAWMIKPLQRKQIIASVPNTLLGFMFFCGSGESELCKDCNNCLRFYELAKDRMLKLGIWR